MRRALLSLLIAMLIASACGGDDEPLPFDAVLLDLFGTDDVDRYRYDIERDAEALLVECMAAAGFEFIIAQPIPPSINPDLFADREYVSEDGFGIVTSFREWINNADPERRLRDPNREYLTTLTGAEIDSYFETLEGEPPEPGQVATNPGCRGRAADQAYSTWNRFLDELANFTAMGEERDTHPDWLAARSDWRDCMLDTGYDYSEPDAIRSDVENRMSMRLEESYPEANLPIVFEDGAWSVAPEADAILDEMLDFEIKAAVANFDCTEPLTDRFRAVEREVQQGFVDRNQETIDSLIAELT
ncbi:MAG: hypothetical protein AAF567_02920 [Actinomycetota bacterium]